jgi:predicted peptidase
MQRKTLAALLVALALAGCAPSKVTTVAPGTQYPERMTTVLTYEKTIEYLVSLPRDYTVDGPAHPLVLFLHGAGERGADLEKVKTHGPPKLAGQGKQFPFILVSPQCPDGEYWSEHALRALLDEVERRYNVDRSREYVTGLSMGGNGTWKLAMLCPDRFAAIAPVCGWGDTTRVRVLKKVPTWVFHGKKDPVVPFASGEAMVRALQTAGGNVRLTAYPDAGHDSWTATYDDPGFYEWLLAQRHP